MNTQNKPMKIKKSVINRCRQLKNKEFLGEEANKIIFGNPKYHKAKYLLQSNESPINNNSPKKQPEKIAKPEKRKEDISKEIFQDSFRANETRDTITEIKKEDKIKSNKSYEISDHFQSINLNEFSKIPINNGIEIVSEVFFC